MWGCAGCWPTCSRTREDDRTDGPDPGAKGLSFTPTLLEFLEASHEVNSSQWTKAIQSLSKLQPILKPMPELKARVNALLARCYDHQGEPGAADALQRAVRANPGYLPALISNLVERGELNQAIEESRKLRRLHPQRAHRLIGLLITRNRQLPEGQRNGGRSGALKQDAAVSPKSAEPLLLRAEMAAARGNIAEAEAHSDRPGNSSPAMSEPGWPPRICSGSEASSSLRVPCWIRPNRRSATRSSCGESGHECLSRGEGLISLRGWTNCRGTPPRSRPRIVKGFSRRWARKSAASRRPEGGIPDLVRSRGPRSQRDRAPSTTARDRVPGGDHRRGRPQDQAGSGRERSGQGGQGRDRTNHRRDQADRRDQRPEHPVPGSPVSDLAGPIRDHCR